MAVKLNECYVVGRFKPRRLRAPLVVGWQGDERAGRATEPTQIALKKQGDALSLQAPDGSRVIKLSAEAAAAARSGDDVCILLGWPEPITLVRRGGTLVYGDGDVVHFGRLDLDGSHTIERVGYQYLSEAGSEVSVELELYDNGNSRRVMLGPGDKVPLGPYEIEHDHSYDPSDRPTGAPHHGYFFRVRRGAAHAIPARPAEVPHPLDITEPGPVIELARKRGLLEPDEALWAEPSQFQARRACYEGPQPKLDATMQQTGPHPPSLTRRGEIVAVESPRIARGEHGKPVYGRATIELAPTGGVRVARTHLGTLPGRMRKSAG